MIEAVKLGKTVVLALLKDAFRNNPDFIFKGGENPYSISYKGTKYNVYIKHLTPAQLSNSNDNIWRIQLPKRKAFDNIKEDNSTFLLLGYDPDSDVYTSWDPYWAKQRLNEASNVSFYSRLSAQQSACVEESFIIEQLNRGGKVIAFPREKIGEYIDKIKEFFPVETKYIPVGSSIKKAKETELVKENPLFPEMTQNSKYSFIEDIDDSEVLGKIENCMNQETPDTLTALGYLSLYFGDKYNDRMTIKDWKDYLFYKWAPSQNGSIETEPKAKNISAEQEPQVEKKSTVKKSIEKESKTIKKSSSDNSSKDFTDKIAAKCLTDSTLLLTEEKKSSVPSAIISFLLKNDKSIFLQIMKSLKPGKFINEGTEFKCYVYEGKKYAVPRFFISRVTWERLPSKRSQNRWAHDIPILFRGREYYVTNQIDGHNIEKKNNVRINDFARFIYEATDKKYFINFIPNGPDSGSGAYIHELRRSTASKKTKVTVSQSTEKPNIRKTTTEIKSKNICRNRYRIIAKRDGYYIERLSDKNILFLRKLISTFGMSTSINIKKIHYYSNNSYYVLHRIAGIEKVVGTLSIFESYLRFSCVIDGKKSNIQIDYE